jgi:hypothetical protein
LIAFLNGKQYEKRIYVGDGSNDYCPSTKLNSGDTVLPRKGMALSNLLLKDEFKSKISATIIEWTSADDVLRIFKEILQ